MKTVSNRVDNITDIKPHQRVSAPPCPKSVKIELTARCNFACAFCASANKLRQKGDMDWGFYSKTLLPQLRAAGVDEVGMFFLGESFLLDWLPEAIAEAKRQGFPYVFLTTNGAAATPEKIERCMAAGLDSLKFSLNYADKEQFESVARVNGKLFDRMIENIKEAHRIRQANGYDCGLYASYIAYDGEQGDKMAKIIAELSPYLDEVYALPLYSQAALTGAEEEKRGWTVRAGNPGRAANMRQPIPCWSIFTEGRVTYDGHLTACCFDHDGRFHMGDLNKEPFAQAWHSEEFQKLRAAHLAGELKDTPCEKCVAYN